MTSNMKFSVAIVAFALLGITVVQAQVTNADRACAQDRATVGSGGDLAMKDGKDGQPQNLSDKLAKSGGIICPPAGIDADIKAPTPEGGKLQVIPPPGTPQNQPHVQPK